MARCQQRGGDTPELGTIQDLIPIHSLTNHSSRLGTRIAEYKKQDLTLNSQSFLEEVVIKEMLPSNIVLPCIV